MKKIIVIILTLILVGCNQLSESTLPRAKTENAGAFKVAILFPGPINDRGWNQSGYEGMKLIKKQLGAEVAYSASVSVTDAAKLFRQYANKNFDFIISHGNNFLDAALEVTKDFPRIKFAIVSSYAGDNRNVGALAFRSGEVGYLAGVVAALKTKTNKVAYIGGQPYPILQEEANLLKRGVQETKPGSQVSIEWLNSWSDEDKAIQIASKEVSAGADVLMVDADRGNAGVIKVAAQKKEVYVIRWLHAIEGLDKEKPTSKSILTSVVQQVPMLLLEGATLVQQGRWEGKQYKFGLLEGVQDFAPFYGSLTAEEEQVVNSIKEDIMTGKIDVSP